MKTSSSIRRSPLDARENNSLCIDVISKGASVHLSIGCNSGITTSSPSTTDYISLSYFIYHKIEEVYLDYSNHFLSPCNSDAGICPPLTISHRCVFCGHTDYTHCCRKYYTHKPC